MATIYSLICFGGKDGKTVTFTDAGDVVNLTAHGLRDGTGVVFTDNGNTLPTGLAKNTTYYAKSTGSGTFTLYTSSALTTQVTFTGTGSGTHKVKSAYYVGLSDKSRWTYGGTEYIYDSLAAWVSGRSGASPLDVEVCEIGMAWSDTITTAINNNVPAAATTITSMVNGVRSGAFHFGDPTAGYELYASSSGPYIVLTLSGVYATLDGVRVTVYSGYYNAALISATAFAPTIKNNIVMGPGGTSSVGSYAAGIGLPASGATCINNRVSGCSRGIGITQYSSGLLVANNIVTKCGTGFYPGASTSIYGNFYNNISIGNTTNWGTASGFTNAAQNAGLAGEAWVSGSYSRVTIATTDFVNYPTDLNAATSSSPQVDTGTEYFGALPLDIAGNEAPSYNNGGSEAYDIGCYEYDNGYGPHPITWTIKWDISGATVRVFETGTQTLVDSTTTGTSFTVDGAAEESGYDVTVEKDGYLRVRMTGITATDGLETTIAQEVDFAYAASSGLTYTTNADFSDGEFSLSAASSVQNFYSFWVETFRTESTYYNTDFPLQANGPFSIKLLNGNEFDNSTSIGYLHTGGIAYVNSSGTTVAQWMGLQTSGVPAGMTAQWAWSDGGTAQSAASSGDINDLIQIYGDVSHGNFDYRSYMVLKAQGEDGSGNLYNQAEVDVVDQFGTLSDSLYVVGLVPTDTGVDYAAPGGTPTITDHGASPVTWNSKDFSITIQTDLSGDQLLAYLRHNATLTVGGVSDQRFDYHDLIRPDGDKYKTVRGAIYGDTGASLKGVRVLNSGGDAHLDFTLFTGDDGSTYAPAVSAAISITGMPTASGAETRLQVINYTASQASAWQATTAYTQGAVVLRTTGVGAENTAGLYMRATTGGTSGGTEPTWDTTVGNTTSDGTVVWTTYAVLYCDADPTTSSYSSTYIDGEEILAGETIKIRFAEMDAGVSFKTYATSLIAASTGFSAAVDTTADSVYAAWAIDGSSYDTTFSPDYVANYLILDTNTDFSGKSAGAYFCYLLTTSQGMYLFWGGMTLIDSGNIRINDSVLSLYFDESAGFVKQTDSVRIFRDDGTRPALDPTTGGAGIEINWRVPVNVVTTGGSAMTSEESAHLLGLTNAPSASSNAAAVRSELASELTRISDLAKRGGVVSGTPVVIPPGDGSIVAGDVEIDMSTAEDGTVTLARV